MEINVRPLGERAKIAEQVDRIAFGGGGACKIESSIFYPQVDLFSNFVSRKGFRQRRRRSIEKLSAIVATKL